jgi:hypothetical protein
MELHAKHGGAGRSKRVDAIRFVPQGAPGWPTLRPGRGLQEAREIGSCHQWRLPTGQAICEEQRTMTWRQCTSPKTPSDPTVYASCVYTVGAECVFRDVHSRSPLPSADGLPRRQSPVSAAPYFPRLLETPSRAKCGPSRNALWDDSGYFLCVLVYLPPPHIGVELQFCTEVDLRPPDNATLLLKRSRHWASNVPTALHFQYS